MFNASTPFSLTSKFVVAEVQLPEGRELPELGGDRTCTRNTVWADQMRAPNNNNDHTSSLEVRPVVQRAQSQTCMKVISQVLVAGTFRRACMCLESKGRRMHFRSRGIVRSGEAHTS